jgi:uncharacterized protein
MLQQTNSGGRVQVMDAIRGLCLLGILIANMLIFQYGIYGKDEMRHFATSQLDETAHSIVKIVVEGSFMPIFMFVFGYGLYKLREGLIQKGLKPGRVLVRRFIMLMGLGLLHGMLLWEGDILTAYGMMGFVLLLFVGRKAKTLLIWSFALMLLLAGFSYGFTSMTPEEADRMSDYVERSITIYGDGSYREISDFRADEDPLGLDGAEAIAMLVFLPIVMMPMFLMGIAAAGKQWFHNPLRERSRYKKLAIILIPLGLLLKAAVVLWQDSAWSGVLHSLGSQLLALGYIFGLALVFSYLSKQFWLRRGVEAVGRMSLTNYLMQTVICTTIFYGYGFGLFGKLGVLEGTLLACVIYVVQAAFSTFMLTIFRNGPIERLLRMWTYWTWSGRSGQARNAPMKTNS